MTFDMKDSGIRQEFESGMVRDVTAGKIDWSLVANGPMLRRWAELLTNGAVVKGYGKRNWMKAAGEDEYERFRESAFRHFMEWYLGERDEDHGAAVFFNINGAEYVDMTPEQGWTSEPPYTPDEYYAPGTLHEYIPGVTPEPSVSGCDCSSSEGDCVGVCNIPRTEVTDPSIPSSAKVGDVTPDDLITVIWEEGGLQDLADDYNYLRNRVQELSNQLNRGVVDEFEADGGW